MKRKFNQSFLSGYTLVETLVASGIIMLAVGAAASLSLTTVTQEEISEKAVRAANYLENAAALYQLGFGGSEITNLLPPEDDVELTITAKTVTVPNLGAVSAAEIQMTFTVGDSAERNHTIQIMKSTY